MNTHDYEQIELLQKQLAEVTAERDAAIENMEYIANTKNICLICGKGCKSHRAYCAKFEWNNSKKESTNV